jgi:hypothetical protein
MNCESLFCLIHVILKRCVTGDEDEASLGLKATSDPNQPAEKAHIVIWQIPSNPEQNK